MTLEPPENDPKIAWKNLKTEPRISAQEIQSKARGLDSTIRRDTIIITVVVLIVTAFVAMWLSSLRMSPRIIVGFVGGIFIGLGCHLYGQYRAYGRVWSRILEPNAGLTTCLDFYRKELERQYLSYSQQARYAPLILFLVALLLFAIAAIRHSPSLLSIVVWGCLPLGGMGGFMLLNARREARKYRRALDELGLEEK